MGSIASRQVSYGKVKETISISVGQVDSSSKSNRKYKVVWKNIGTTNAFDKGIGAHNVCH